MSSLYGSEALGGVIQLFTNRWPDAPRISGSAGYGSYKTGQVNGGVSAGSDSTGFTLNAGYTGTDGFSATKPTAPAFAFNPDDDGYRNTNASASLVHMFAPDQEIGLSGFYSKGRTHFDSGAASDDINNETIGVYSAYSRNRLAPWWQSLVRIGASDDALAFDGSFAGDIDSHQTQATWQNDFATPAGTVIAGLELLHQSVAGNTAFTVDQRNIYSGFAGYTGEFGRHTLHASLRNDDNSQFGSQTTGALGYAVQLSPQWRVRASAGTAFQAPTFFDLYDPFVGNPNLQPEESTSWEAGVDFRMGAQRFAVTYFDNHITNLVVFDAAANTLENLNEARNPGRRAGLRRTTARAGAARAPHRAGPGERPHRQPLAAARRGVRQCRHRAQLWAGALGRRGGRRRTAVRFRQRGAEQPHGRLRDRQLPRDLRVRAQLERRPALEQCVRCGLRAGAELLHGGQQRVPVGALCAALTANCVRAHDSHGAHGSPWARQLRYSALSIGFNDAPLGPHRSPVTSHTGRHFLQIPAH